VGVAGWPVTPVDGGRSQHYCGGLDCGLPLVAFWYITRTQNVSEYMLVLALCLVVVSAETTNTFKNRLDKFWSDQDVLYDYKADLHGIGNRSVTY